MTLKPMKPEDAATVHERDESLNKALAELLVIARRSPVLHWLGSSVSLADGEITVTVTRADRRPSRRGSGA